MPPDVQVRSTVGAGDSTVAGLVLKLSQGGSLEEASRLAVAAGTAATLTSGTELCHKEDVEKLLLQVTVERLLFYKKEGTKNILAFTAGAANVGYFGLPVAMMIFSDKVFSLVVLSVMGFILYESTLGFFISANGSHSVRASLIKTAKLPAIYAFVLGLSLNLAGVGLGGTIVTTVAFFKGAYSLLGMMLIGMGLASVCKASLDIKFISLSFL